MLHEKHFNGMATELPPVEVPLFVLHQTGRCWWIYKKINDQYVKVWPDLPPSLQPGDLVNLIIKKMDCIRFEVQILRS